MTTSVTIRLPWPDKRLSPNARGHWAVLVRAKKKAREDGYLAVLERGVRRLPVADRYSVSLTFYPPDRRRRDTDNMVASLKAYLDGISDALRVDDSRFDLEKPVVTEPVKGGAVLVELRPAGWRSVGEVARKMVEQYGQQTASLDEILPEGLEVRSGPEDVQSGGEGDVDRHALPDA